MKERSRRVGGPATRRSVVLVWGTLFLSTVLWFPLARPAAAHTSFEGSDPVDGSVLTASVGRIGLSFTEPARPVGEGFVVLADGRLRAPDGFSPNGDGTVWTLRFDPPLSSGDVGLRWTVQAPDAHPISGSLSFRIDLVDTGDGMPSASASSAESIDRRAGSEGGSVPSGPDRTASSGAASPEASNSNPVTTLSQTEQEVALDEFLRPSRPYPVLSGELSAFGRFAGYGGALLIVGGLAFIVGPADRRRDRLVVLRLIGFAAPGLMLGVALELVGYLTQVAGSWSAMFDARLINAERSTAFVLALALRFCGGVMAFAAANVWRAELRPRPAATAVPRPSATRATSRAGVALGGDPSGVDESPPVPRRNPRPGRIGGRRSLLRTVAEFASRSVLAGAAVFVLVSFTFDGHTVTRADPVLIAMTDLLHVFAAAVWAGGLVAMALVLAARRSRGEPLRALTLAVRFSVPAAVGVVGAAVSGTALTVLIVDDWASLIFSPWGRLLLAKVALVLGCASIGAYNHFVIIPELHDVKRSEQASDRLRRTVSLEAAGIVLVVGLSALLTGSGT